MRKLHLFGILVLTPGFSYLVIGSRESKFDFSNLPWDPPSTFSILGYDPDSGEIGAAVQSRVFSVGNGVLWAEAGVGAAATQAIVDVSYGPQAIELLKKGLAPKDIIKTVLDHDPDPRPADWTKKADNSPLSMPKAKSPRTPAPK